MGLLYKRSGTEYKMLTTTKHKKFHSHLLTFLKQSIEEEITIVTVSAKSIVFDEIKHLSSPLTLITKRIIAV